ncbi:hypothetical protein F4809DRAFT_600816 [Biscogniauxia mediterranea]|nr:hypothetical protein F4809DRAFT_600816 [Biscogniauxia mediterranea]
MSRNLTICIALLLITFLKWIYFYSLAYPLIVYMSLCYGPYTSPLRLTLATHSVVSIGCLETWGPVDLGFELRRGTLDSHCHIPSLVLSGMSNER